MILYIFQAFYEVWRKAREHRKLRHFITAQKTRENTRLLYRLSVISYYRRVFDMFVQVFFNGKTCDFQPYKKAGKLPYKSEGVHYDLATPLQWNCILYGKNTLFIEIYRHLLA